MFYYRRVFWYFMTETAAGIVIAMYYPMAQIEGIKPINFTTQFEERANNLCVRIHIEYNIVTELLSDIDTKKTLFDLREQSLSLQVRAIIFYQHEQI